MQELQPNSVHSQHCKLTYFLIINSDEAKRKSKMRLERGEKLGENLAQEYVTISQLF